MKRLIFIPLLIFSITLSAQFTKSGVAFLKTGSSFMTATAPVVPPASSLLTGLVAYYKLDEASGTVLDAINDNDGTNYSASANQTGKLGTAYVFSVNDSISMGNAADLTKPDTAGAIAAWIYVTGTNAYGMVASKINFNTKRNGYALWIASGTHIRGGGASASSSYYIGATETTPLTRDAWHHIVLTWDDTQDSILIYKDGVKMLGTTQPIGVWTPSPNRFRLGQNRDYGESVIGTVDEVAVYGRKLTKAEVVELYNGGTGITYPFE